MKTLKQGLFLYLQTLDQLKCINIIVISWQYKNKKTTGLSKNMAVMILPLVIGCGGDKENPNASFPVDKDTHISKVILGIK